MRSLDKIQTTITPEEIHAAEVFISDRKTRISFHSREIGVMLYEIDRKNGWRLYPDCHDGAEWAARHCGIGKSTFYSMLRIGEMTPVLIHNAPEDVFHELDYSKLVLVYENIMKNKNNPERIKEIIEQVKTCSRSELQRLTHPDTAEIYGPAVISFTNKTNSQAKIYDFHIVSDASPETIRRVFQNKKVMLRLKLVKEHKKAVK